MNIKNEFWHQELIDLDLPVIAEQFDDFETIYSLFLITINKAKNNPIHPSRELLYDLTGWNEYKFFSDENPPLQVKPNMSIVYHYNEMSGNFYVLAVGFRNSKETRESKRTAQYILYCYRTSSKT